MKQIVFTLLLLFSTIVASATTNAAPAKRIPFTVTQSDGTQITLVLVGDEHLHYYENIATGEKMRRGDDGDYYVITTADFNNMQSVAKARMQQSCERRRERMAKLPTLSAGGPRKAIGQYNNMTGRKKGIVILVNFADKLMTTGTQAKFNDMFNKEGYNANGHIGSVADYFKAQSYGQFELEFDVVGPVTLSNNMAYYGGNSSSGNDLRPAQMAKEACNLVNSEVNFADYDWSSDGYVDQVFIIYAGYGENYNGADENTIWPHEWDFVSAGIGVLSIDGVKVKTYACCAELYGTTSTKLNGMGTACHEFSHCLGYPDSYDTDYSGGIGMDSYDVMCGGSYNGPNGRGEVPSGYTAYERWMAGWLEPTTLSGPANITDMPDLGTSASAYIIYNNNNANEYFLLENRQAKDWFKYFDKNTAGHGLFITHIDYNTTVWSNNEPNDDPDHQRMTWVPADKDYGTYSSSNKAWSVSSAQQKGDYFPGTSSVKSFTPSNWSTAGGKWFNLDDNNSYYSSHSLSEITENTTAGTVSFKVDGGDDGTRYTITYNAGAGSCTTASWTQTISNAEATTLPSCTINSQEWSFAGWCTANVSNTTTKPTLLKAGDKYTPTANITLNAVYTKTEAGGVGGSYTLDYNAETDLKSKSLGYGNAVNYTATDGGAWVIKAYKNNGLQINSGKDASIKVPECASPITSIDITKSTTKKVSFSSTDYTGSNSPSAAATSSGATSETLNLSGKGLTTGYIYTTDGSSAITKIVVNYGAGSTTYYATSPSLTTLPTPTITFDTPADKALKVGDSYTNTATASCDGVDLPEVTYSSSVESVATVDASGMVTAVGVGTTTITANVAKVDGKSKAVFTTYKVTVTMPALESIAITTQPTKLAYTEGETFSTSGMVVTANYANGYSKVVADYTCTPSTETALTTADDKVTVSYTENEVTKTADVAITVNALPKYAVTFNVCGKETIITEESYQSGVSVPSVEDVDVYTFLGWVTTEAQEESTTLPTLVTLNEGKYMPSQDVTLYAMFKRTEDGGDVTLFEEIFDMEGTDEVTEIEGFTSLSKVYANNGNGIRLSSSKNAGKLVKTAMSNLNGTAEITFKVLSYSSTENGSLALSAKNGGSLSTTSFTGNSATKWLECSTTLTNGTSSTTIEFNGTANKRIYIKDLKIVGSGKLHYFTTSPTPATVSIQNLVNLIDRLNRAVEGAEYSDIETLVKKILGKE